jgi:hypothetical protein
MTALCRHGGHLLKYLRVCFVFDAAVNGPAFEGDDMTALHGKDHERGRQPTRSVAFGDGRLTIADRLEHHAHTLSDRRAFSFVQDGGGAETRTWAEVPDALPDAPALESTVSLEDLAILQYSSGSSGTPRGVMVSNARWRRFRWRPIPTIATKPR